MITAALIIFREIFEIALIISIITASTNNIKNSKKSIAYGILLGIILSIIFGVFFNFISSAFSGAGQEIFNLIVILITIVLIIYTIVWMKNSAASYNQKIKQKSYLISTGAEHLYSLTLIIAFALLREGVEISLFISGMIITGVNFEQIIIGTVIGISLGIVATMTIYFGILRLSHRYFFTITSWLLIVLAISLATELARILLSLGILSNYSYPIWDSSWLISDDSLVGNFLGVFIGYHAKPSLVEIFFAIFTLLAVIIINKIASLYSVQKQKNL